MRSSPSYCCTTGNSATTTRCGVLDSLHRRYPRNRLVMLEAGATATRGNRPADAEKLLTEGMAMLAGDKRPRIPGEEALWHYKRGAARVMLGRRDEALADLRAALAPGAAGWVQGRAHLEMARLALKQGDRAGRAARGGRGRRHRASGATTRSAWTRRSESGSGGSDGRQSQNLGLGRHRRSSSAASSA